MLLQGSVMVQTPGRCLDRKQSSGHANVPHVVAEVEVAIRAERQGRNRVRSTVRIG